jgi:hypothetical protein
MREAAYAEADAAYRWIVDQAYAIIDDGAVHRYFHADRTGSDRLNTYTSPSDCGYGVILTASSAKWESGHADRANMNVGGYDLDAVIENCAGYLTAIHLTDKGEQHWCAVGVYGDKIALRYLPQTIGAAVDEALAIREAKRVEEGLAVA